tara:strand:- start:253 stop:603 length:351 start_codon:yes stop_codon:yes gene_type:complete
VKPAGNWLALAWEVNKLLIASIKPESQKRKCARISNQNLLEIRIGIHCKPSFLEKQQAVMKQRRIRRRCSGPDAVLFAVMLGSARFVPGENPKTGAKQQWYCHGNPTEYIPDAASQ